MMVTDNIKASSPHICVYEAKEKRKIVHSLSSFQSPPTRAKSYTGRDECIIFSSARTFAIMKCGPQKSGKTGYTLYKQFP
jgi:hypothetical protein